MKKAKLLVVLVFLVFGAMAQPVLHWKFDNVQHIQQGADCFFQFDVMLSATQAGTFHSSMQIYFDYNTAAFGTAIVSAGNVTYERLGLMDLLFGANFAYNTLPPGTQGADNKPYRYAILTEAVVVMGNPMFMEEVPVFPTYNGFLRFKIKVLDPAQLAGIAFVPSEGGVPLMNEGQYYVTLGGSVETKYGVPPLYEGIYENDLLTATTGCGPLAPGCTTLVSPLDGATGVGINDDITWNAEPTATGYKLSWNGGPDMDLMNVLTYDPGMMAYNTLYTWKITPYNAGGDAVGCPTWSFTTEIFIPTDATWTGAVDNDWFNPLNWNPPTVPVDIPVIIPAVDAFPPIILGGAASVSTMAISAGAQLTIAPTGSLTASGLITNDGAIYITSDGTGAAGSLIDNGYLGGGTFQFDRDMLGTGAYQAPAGWHLLAGPVNNFTSDGIYDYWLNTYDATTQLYVQQYAVQILPAGCTPLTPALPLSPMVGWSIKQDVTYAGPINYLGQADICETVNPGTGLVIEFQGNMGNVNTGAYVAPFVMGWNLYGNPYPSSVDASVFTIPAGLNAAVYKWDDLNMTWESYVGGVGNPLVAPTQAFFMNAVAGGNFGLGNADRAHGGIFKSEVENVLELVATGNGYADKTYVRFMNETSTGFDGNWDAYKMISNVPEVPQIYTTAGSDNLSINSQPAASTVPMSFSAGNSGTFTITASENQFETVYLEDKMLGVLHNLKASPYTFEYVAGENASRFVIHFGQNSVEAENGFVIYSSESNIFVNNLNNVSGHIVVYTMMGQEIMNVELTTGMNTLRVADQNANFIVKVLSDNAVASKKVNIR